MPTPAFGGVRTRGGPGHSRWSLPNPRVPFRLLWDHSGSTLEPRNGSHLGNVGSCTLSADRPVCEGHLNPREGPSGKSRPAAGMLLEVRHGHCLMASEIGLEHYEGVFRENDIDAEVLPELNADDLSAIGMASVGHRRKILAAISALRSAGAADAPHRHETRAPSATQPIPRRPDAERRQITVMFCDLVGSTALSTRLDPEDMGQAISSYQTACSDAVKHWGGHVAKFMGDGVLVYFGWPQAHEDDAERAVRAGLDLIVQPPGFRRRG